MRGGRFTWFPVGTSRVIPLARGHQRESSNAVHPSFPMIALAIVAIGVRLVPATLVRGRACISNLHGPLCSEASGGLHPGTCRTSRSAAGSWTSPSPRASTNSPRVARLRENSRPVQLDARSGRADSDWVTTLTSANRDTRRSAGALPERAHGGARTATSVQQRAAQSRQPLAPTSSRRRRRVAPRVGLEPTTLRLTAECSTIELPGNVGRKG